MKKQLIQTNLGTIAVFKQIVPNTTPIFFLHGVYYDHQLWKHQLDSIKDHTVIAVDMPFHGESKPITNKNWTLQDCVDMLLELIEKLGYAKVYAIGHSWGSMTILRAAASDPEKFHAIGLCNMPLNRGSFSTKIKFSFQHLLLGFRAFYIKQVAKFMFAPSSLEEHPEYLAYLQETMSTLSNAQLRQTDKAVIMNSDDGFQYVNQLTVPALALRGKQDYVALADSISTRIVQGAHTSPLEAPNEVNQFIQEVLALT